MRELNAVFLQEDNVHTNIPDLSATCAPPACTKLMFPMCSIPANTPSTSCIWSIERCITSKACYKQEEQHNIYCVRNILHLLTPTILDTNEYIQFLINLFGIKQFQVTSQGAALNWNVWQKCVKFVHVEYMLFHYSGG